MAEFFCDKNLTLLNDPESPPTFVGSKGHSWIDLTATSPAVLSMIGGWSVRENTASDHNYISFYLDSEAVPSVAPIRFTRNQWRLRRALKSVSGELANLEGCIEDIQSGQELEDFVARLYT